MCKDEPYLSVDRLAVESTLAAAAGQKIDQARIDDICDEAELLKGLDRAQVAYLLHANTPEARERIFQSAGRVKGLIYGPRLVLFAPLYISNLCSNECVYCAFRASNTRLRRMALSQEQIREETEILISQGHKRILLVAGESYPREGLDYVARSIRTIYDTRAGNGEVRRVNVNVAPLSVDGFKQLRDCGIGTYQLFQETYHPDVYKALHLRGKKRDYGYRLDTMDRAMAAGIDDVGIGLLFGLADFKWEVLAMLQHIDHLEERFGMGPHTISVPRIEPADGSDFASNPPHPVTDDDFRLIIAVLRLAVPYTGIILSTREGAGMRSDAFRLGVSQISAGSRTNPGGYHDEDEGCDGAGPGLGQAGSQFSLGDHRPLDEVIRDISQSGYIPSFCTGCYRKGRTGHEFMDMAKPGNIKSLCIPNAITTFQEYLIDFGSEETRAVGEPLIERMIGDMGDTELARQVSGMVARIKAGERDLYL